MQHFFFFIFHEYVFFNLFFTSRLFYSGVDIWSQEQCENFKEIWNTQNFPLDVATSEILNV